MVPGKEGIGQVIKVALTMPALLMSSEILPIFTAKTAIHETWMKCNLAVCNPIRANI